MRLLRFIVVLGLMLSFVSVAQTTLGLHSSGASDVHSFDTINLSNLAVVVSVPARNKIGAVPFSFNFVQQASYAPQSANPVVWSMQGLGDSFIPGGPPFISASYETFGPYWCSSRSAYEPYYMYWAIVDASGAQHAFADVSGIPFYLDSCTRTSATVTTVDGSGYTLVVNTVPKLSYTIYDSSGNKTVQTSTGSAGNTTTTTTFTDTNANTITSVRTLQNYSCTTPCEQWTDTMGMPVMSQTGYVYSYTDSAGNPQSYTLSYSTAKYTWLTAFGCSGVQDKAPYGPATAPNGVILPDGSSLNVTYEQTPGKSSGYITGRVASVTLPTGGQITYGYSGGNNGINCADGTTATLTRTTLDGAWTYTHVPAAGGVPATTTVTDPGGNDTVYSFAAGNLPACSTCTSPTLPSFVTQKQVFVGSKTANQLALSEVTCYNGAASNCNSALTVSLPISEKDVYTYLGGSAQPSVSKLTYNTIYGFPIEDKEYDFDGVSLLQDTVTQYGSYTGGSCTQIGNFINNRQCIVQVKDAGGHIQSQTNRSYDTYGNLVSKSDLVSGTTYVTTAFTYDPNGAVKTVTDVNGTVTTHTNTSCNNLLPTSVSVANLSRSYTWDCNGGVMKSISDANNQPVSYTYNDPLYRVTSISDALGNATNYSYGKGQSSVESKLQFNTGGSLTERLVSMDAYGRPSVFQTEQGPSSSNYDTVTERYDSTDRPVFVSLPCRALVSAGCSGSAGTYTAYDVVGRTASTTDGEQPIPASVANQYSQNDVLTTLSPAPAGENTKRRQLEYDGLGRLTSVCEILTTGGTSCGQNTSASGYRTSYTYSVQAAGGSKMVVTQGVQTRTYLYDGLGRLTSETNPESGITTYTYDSGASSACAAGYTSKGDLVQKIDANGNSTCYYYDTLHRLTDVGTNQLGGYCRRFRYDNTVGVTGTKPPGIAISNSMGRVAEAETDNCTLPITPITDEWFSYSPRGENTDMYESTPHSGTPYYHTTAAYWANGTIQSLGGIPGYTGLVYGIDGEGRGEHSSTGDSKDSL